MSIESFGSNAATMRRGSFVGLLIGYALKKVIKIVAVIFGLFLAGLAYLQYHQIANNYWNKLLTVSEDASTTLLMQLLYRFQVLAVVVVLTLMLLQQPPY